MARALLKLQVANDLRALAAAAAGRVAVEHEWTCVATDLADAA